MYFYATLLIGIALLYVEARAVCVLVKQIHRTSTPKKWAAWSSLLVLGLTIGFLCAFAEYPSPFSEHTNIHFISFPVLAAANDGKRDFLSMFTIPALVLNFTIGLLAPVLVSTQVIRRLTKRNEASVN